MFQALGCVAFFVGHQIAMTAWHCAGETYSIRDKRDIDVALVAVAGDNTDYEYSELACRDLIGKELTLNTIVSGQVVKMKIHPIMVMKLYELPGVTGYGYLIKEKLWVGASGSPIVDTDGKVVAIVHGWRNPDMWIITRTCL